MFVNVIQLFLPLFGLAVSAAIAFGASYLRQRTKNEIFGRAVTAVENVVRATVLEAQQTMVDELKEKGNGKLTDGEQLQVKNEVLKAVRSRLSEETLRELQGVTADVEEYLSSLIEAYVYRNKMLPVGKS
jgi:hypothetical protein